MARNIMKIASVASSVLAMGAGAAGLLNDGDAPVIDETVHQIAVSCEGDQVQIDNCQGATVYGPVSDYLGVPYYAQHNGMGGEQWLSYKVGDTVVVQGVTYQISSDKIVETSGDIDQIANLNGDAYLQTCLDDHVHSRVMVLTKVA